MNNTEKKLDALIDALGFDVEEVVTTVHPPFSIMKACFTDRYNQQGPVHTVNYKLTKRDEPVRDWSVTGNDLIGSLDKFYDDVSLRQLVENINQLSVLDEKYRWIQYPLDSYYAVKVYFSSKMPITSSPTYFKVLGVKVMLDE
jgi:hypothetical protein